MLIYQESRQADPPRDGVQLQWDTSPKEEVQSQRGKESKGESIAHVLIEKKATPFIFCDCIIA